MRLLNQFDTIAPFYDRLAALVFGRSIRRAQTHHLKSLPQTGNVLLLGGGTGWLAVEMLRHSDLTMVYIEASQRMLAIAKKKLSAFDSRVHFIHGTESSIPPGTYDIIVTNFFLDLFDGPKLNEVISHLRRSMHRDSRWLVTDFVSDQSWHRLYLSVMYFFFRATCGIEVRRLPPWEEALASAGFRKDGEAAYFGGFMKTILGKISA